ncbi:MAG: aminoacyl-tRNA hydrolase [Anaerolineales bacterium]
MPDKFLIVGLGNPGRDYRHNRHNVGYMTLDRLVERHRLMGFTKRQGKALITTGQIAGASVILAKPQTYMNLSGEAVGSLLRSLSRDLPLERLLVCFDDIDLPVGAIRLRPEGGSAGQNGMKSIIQSLGTEKFPRLRIGVGRPPGRMDAAAYVLQDFKGDEAEIINATLDRAVEAIEVFVNDGIVVAMNRFNAPGQVTGDE